MTSVLVEFAEYIPQEAATWVTSAVAFVTAVSVFLVKNATIIDAAGDGLNRPVA